MRGLPIAVIVVPAVIAGALMMFFAHYPLALAAVVAIWLIWTIITWRIEAAKGRRGGDVERIQHLEKQLSELRQRSIEEWKELKTEYYILEDKLRLVKAESEMRLKKILELNERLNVHK